MSRPANYSAFLDALAWCEGTDNGRQPTNCRGYDVIVGGSLFTDFSRHPNKLIPLPSYGIKSTAAGRYQFIIGTWRSLQQRLKLTDFSPASQDAAALELLRECGSLRRLDENDLRGALQAARKIWASLPGAGYGQKEQKYEDIKKIYVAAGGVVQV